MIIHINSTIFQELWRQITNLFPPTAK